MNDHHKDHDDEHHNNLRGAIASLLTVGVILLMIACLLLGLDLAGHHHFGSTDPKDTVNVKVSQSQTCNSGQPSIPTVNGNG